MALIQFKKEGLFCPQADVYIDPLKRVDKALITHAHADHARRGNKSYLASDECLPFLYHRLGKINAESLPYGKRISINGVKVSFHPAGHILGSAQVRLEYKGEIWVISGDYKVEDDGFSGKFEPVPCTHFVTESTFALPVFQWEKQDSVFNEMNSWWAKNKNNGITSIIQSYSLGKAQRVLQGLDMGVGKVYVHSSIFGHNEVARSIRPEMNPYHLLEDQTEKEIDGGVIIAPSSTLSSPWFGQLKAASVASASGWMQTRGARKTRSVDKGFVLSDHADWIGLNQAVENTGAENIFVTHGYSTPFASWLREKGYNAKVVESDLNTAKSNVEE